MRSPLPWSRRRFLTTTAAGLATLRSGAMARAAEADAQELLFFDACTTIGPRINKPAPQQWRLEDLQAEMQHCSVSGALVSYTLSSHYDAGWSNVELSRKIADAPGLFAVWNVLPHAGGEFPEPARLGSLMREHGVRAVALHPVTNAWSLKAGSSRRLLTWLEDQRVLTILARAELRDYDELAALLHAHPQLPVLLTGATWSQQRQVIPLLTTHRNLHLTFDSFQIFNGLEYLVAAGCEDQLLFGSNAPVMSMGAHRAYVDYADLPLATRRKIVGGNLTRLLRGLAPGRLQTNAAEDALMRAARRGRPLPVPVIDMHMHILDEGLHGGGEHYRMWQGDARGSFALGRRLGYAGGSVMSWNGTVSGDSVGGNATIQRVLDAAPPGFFGAATFDPVHYSKAELSTLIPRCYEDRRMIGMKPYTRYGLEYTHPGYDAWWEYGNAHQLYALLHRTRSDFREVETLARRFPRVRWMVAHAGMTWAAADQAIATMKQFPNVYAEITYTSVPLGIIEHLVEHAGADRVVFGSDLSMRDPRQQLGWVVFSRLSEATKAKVLAGNALRLLEPCLSRLPSHNRPVIPVGP